MAAEKKLPPEDVIREDSEPSVTEIKEPKKPDEEGVDIDDAQIQEPRDDAFRRSPQPAQPPKQQRKNG
jgi:hypothetical protein